PEGAASPTAAPPGADARESPMGDAEPTPRTARPASTTEAADARESELTGARTAVAGRAIVALVGWPPIGLAIVALLGELSGCGRFAASCGTEVVGAFGVATWLVQLVVVGVLFALPPLARAAAGGSIALLAASIPVAVFLSAIGGARDPATASVLLVGLLGVAWIVGVAIELAGGQATRSAFWRRVG
ncbi:MAG TPA: hypothetical protein VGK63_00475, partial [Candidatus Limnocylindrales bacterium]